MKESKFYLHKPMMGYTNADNTLKIVLSMLKNGKSEENDRKRLCKVKYSTQTEVSTRTDIDGLV